MQSNSSKNTYQCGNLSFYPFKPTHSLVQFRTTDLFSMTYIFKTDRFDDYERLVICIKRHKKCIESTCLRKKGSTYECLYKAPWELNLSSSLFIDSNYQKTYNHTHHDDRLNSYNRTIMSIWWANVDFQPTLSINVVEKYITKYASKLEKMSKSFHHMLQIFFLASPNADPATSAIQKFLGKTLLDRDIGAHDTYHMLQKFH